MTPFGIRKRLRALFTGNKGEKKGAATPRPEAPRVEVGFTAPGVARFVVAARPEDSIVMASGRGPVQVATGCNDGTCGTCRVEVLAGPVSEATEHELTTKAKNGVPDGLRLGCQTRIQGAGVDVRIVNVLGAEP